MSTVKARKNSWSRCHKTPFYFSIKNFHLGTAALFEYTDLAVAE